MALFKNVGSILKRNISQNCAWSMLNSARCMSTEIFIAGLSCYTNNNALRDAFSQHGRVLNAKVITNIETGESRGFGFVKFADAKSANIAVESMDGQELHGERIRVKFSNKRPSDIPSGPRVGRYGQELHGQRIREKFSNERPSDIPSGPRVGRYGRFGPYSSGSGSGYGDKAGGGGGFPIPCYDGGVEAF